MSEVLIGISLYNIWIFLGFASLRACALAPPRAKKRRREKIWAPCTARGERLVERPSVVSCSWLLLKQIFPLFWLWVCVKWEKTETSKYGRRREEWRREVFAQSGRSKQWRREKEEIKQWRRKKKKSVKEKEERRGEEMIFFKNIILMQKVILHPLLALIVLLNKFFWLIILLNYYI